MLEVEVAGQTLLLLAQRAVYWMRERALLVADVHFGKAAAFRANGVQGTTTESLARIDALVERCGAREIVFLGDFLHARESRAPATLAALRRWRAHRRELALTLVRGNHDAHSGPPPVDLGVEVVDEPHLRAPFALCHHPQARAEGYVLAGHLHPAYRLCGRGDESVPCFWFDHAVGVLPAFASRTGAQPIEPGSGDRVFLATPQQVRAVPI